MMNNIKKFGRNSSKIKPSFGTKFDDKHKKSHNIDMITKEERKKCIYISRFYHKNLYKNAVHYINNILHYHNIVKEYQKEEDFSKDIITNPLYTNYKIIANNTKAIICGNHTTSYYDTKNGFYNQFDTSLKQSVLVTPIDNPDNPDDIEPLSFNMSESIIETQYFGKIQDCIKHSHNDIFKEGYLCKKIIIENKEYKGLYVVMKKMSIDKITTTTDINHIKWNKPIIHFEIDSKISNKTISYINEDTIMNAIIAFFP